MTLPNEHRDPWKGFPHLQVTLVNLIQSQYSQFQALNGASARLKLLEGNVLWLCPCR